MSEPSGHDARLQLSCLVDGEVESGEVAGICGTFKSDELHRRTWHAYQLIGDALRSEELATDPARDCDFLAKLRERLAEEPVVLAPHADVADVADVADEVAGRQVAGVVDGRVSGAVVHASRSASFATAQRWKTPITVAASVLAVTGVLMVARVSGLLPADSAPTAVVAQQGSGSVAQRVASVSASPADPSGIQTVSVKPAVPNADDVDGAASLSAVQPQTLVASGKLIRDARLDQYLAAHKQFGGSTALGVPSGFLRSATSESRDR